jgi:hypothetical protein
MMVRGCVQMISDNELWFSHHCLTVTIGFSFAIKRIISAPSAPFFYIVVLITLLSVFQLLHIYFTNVKYDTFRNGDVTGWCVHV